MSEYENFIDNDREFFSGLLNPTGRLRRFHFGLYAIIYVVLVFFLAVLGGLVTFLGGTIGMLVMLLLIVCSYIPFFIAIVKRYHDFGWSGWVPGTFLIINVVWSVCVALAYGNSMENMMAGKSLILPSAVSSFSYVISALQLVVFFLLPLFMPGAKGFNRYGSNPKRNFAVQCEEAGITYKKQKKEE